ncbi:hypothetical protein [Flavivirga algicola]|uniref:Glycerophosphoryl diester phosphodiesterase membrane domain-containing protein n=1 Tax=Flavivirga algicola TaxID=2729136 RepID=A0ABX1S3J1_9FLAO|nr:hypothetical protein [Flavivirga algicola]NMH89810.1 hypothetical protein [Flavivirga algicola]
MHTLESLLKKVNNSKSLDFGTIINHTIELFKKIWLKGFLMVLIMVVFAVIISFLFSLIGLTSTNNFFINNNFDMDAFFSQYAGNVLFSVPQTILLSAITIAFVGAFYQICRQVDSGGNVVDDYFYFFKKEYFSKLLMLGIIYTGIATLAQLMFFIPYIYVFVPLSYFSVVFANNPNLSEMDIVKASFAIGNKKWLITFGTMFVAGILGMLGMIACFIGVLFTLSIIYLPVFFIYKEVIGFDNTSEIDQIGAGNDLDYQ